MTINDILYRLDHIKNILYKDGNNEISKGLKIKLLNYRIKLSKVEKGLNEDIKEFSEIIIPPELNRLMSKSERTIEEDLEIQNMNNKIQDEYEEFLIVRGREEIDIEDLILTEEEYQEIAMVNINHDVEILNNYVSAQDFLICIHNLFVK